MSSATHANTAIQGFTVAEALRGLSREAFVLSGPDWHPAVVPGGVHESLLAAGVIEDPNFDGNEDSVRWIEERDWWFRTRFAGVGDLVQGERLRLIFHGLDTVVTIWLNGVELGRSINMFRPAEFDVTGELAAENELLLRFSPPLADLSLAPTVRELHRRLASLMALASGADAPAEAPEAGGQVDVAAIVERATSSGMDPDGWGEDAQGSVPPGSPGMGPLLPLSTGRRKATFSWGWDFGPRVPSIGIWRPVELVRETPAAIIGHHVGVTSLTTGAASVALRVETRDAVSGLVARVTLTAPSGVTSAHDFPFAGDTASSSITVEDAELWWTHDLGAPNLYDVRIETVLDGVVQAALDDRIGLRTIALDQRPDEGGRLFRFILNGVPVFARGACWVPASMLVGSVNDDRYRELLTLAREGNMNMIRIWGGGVYEHDAFYRETDEQGLLVWQDFMFACTDYPSADPELRAEVQAEATYQVRRLRNRASIGLWCGNNEVQMIHGFAYQGYEQGGDWGYQFFNEILPDTVAREDGRVPYWPGSPYGEAAAEGFMAVNGVLDGDRHAWEVWHGGSVGVGGEFDSVGESRHPRRYAHDTGRFISEFGIHASPELSTLKRWIPESELAIHSESFDAHNKDHPKDKHDALLEIVTGLPRTIEQYVEYTMVSQGEGLKFGIEHYRRRQPHCSGTLIWQLNDVWPGFSWSVIDFDLVPKAGYYYAARAFEPVLASFKPVPDGAELWVSNSSGETLETTARISRVGMDGAMTAAEEVAVSVAAGESLAVWSGTIAAAEILWVDGEGLERNRFFAGDVKDLRFAEHSLTHTATSTGSTSAEITIRSQGYNYLTHIPSPSPGVRFSDNYLDLRDGEAITITVTGLPEGYDPAGLTVAAFIGAAE